MFPPTARQILTGLYVLQNILSIVTFVVRKCLNISGTLGFDGNNPVSG